MTKRRSISTILTLALAGLALMLSGLSAPATAATTGGVKGTITSGGKVLPGMKVELMQSDYEAQRYVPIASRTTNSAGAYSFSGIRKLDQWGDGYRYRIRVRDPRGAYVTTVRDFTVITGKTVTRNATIKPAGFLTGKVLRADGATPTATRVHLIGPDVNIGTDDLPVLAYGDERGVTASGTYRFAGLPPGNYTVRYTDTSGKYLDECYDNVPAAGGADATCDSAEVPTAKVVTVAARATSTLADQELSTVGSHVSGTVTSTAGTPIPLAYVTPVPVGSNSRAWADNFSPTTSTGSFARGPIPSGQWQLYVEDGKGNWASQWVGGTNQATAQVFDLSPGEKVQGIAIKLKSRAVLSVKTTAGATSATFVISVTRKVTGSAATGQVSASLGANTKTATLTNGKATIKLTGVPAGTRTFRIHYSGSSNTSTGTKYVTATVG